GLCFVEPGEFCVAALQCLLATLGRRAGHLALARVTASEQCPDGLGSAAASSAMGCSRASGYVSSRRSALSVSPAAQQRLGRMALDRHWHTHLRWAGVQCCGALVPGDWVSAAATVCRHSDTLGAGQGARSSGPICCCWGYWHGGAMARR